MDQDSDESYDGFASRVQSATADSLYLQVSNHSVSDKVITFFI